MRKIIFFILIVVLSYEVFFSFISLKYIRCYDQPPETGDETWALDLALTSIEKKEPKTFVWLENIPDKVDYGYFTPWIYIWLYGIPMRIRGNIDIYLGRLISFTLSLILLFLFFLLFKVKLRDNLLALLLITLPLLNYNFLYASHNCRGEILICLGAVSFFILIFTFRYNKWKSFVSGLFLGISMMGLIGFPIALAIILTEELFGFFQFDKNSSLKKFLTGFALVAIFLLFINYTYIKYNQSIDYTQIFLTIPLIELLKSGNFPHIKEEIFRRLSLIIDSMGWEILAILVFFFFILIKLCLRFKKGILIERSFLLSRLFKVAFLFISVIFTYFFIYPSIRGIYLSFFYTTILYILAMLCETGIKMNDINIKKIIYALIFALLVINLFSFRNTFAEYKNRHLKYRKYYANHQTIAEELSKYFKGRSEKPRIMGILAFYQYLDRSDSLNYYCYEKYLHETKKLDPEILKIFLKSNKINYWLFSAIDYDNFNNKCPGWDEFFRDLLNNKILEPIKIFNKEIFYFNKQADKVILFKVNLTDGDKVIK